jgi:beta-lactamase regulating signal transducer with metallopeptidase domain
MFSAVVPLDVWLVASAKGSVIIVTGLVCGLLLRRAAAAARHIVLWIALSAQLLVPVAPWLVRGRSLVVAVPQRPSAMFSTMTAPVARVFSGTRTAGPDRMAPATLNWRRWISAFLMIGVLFALLRLAIAAAVADRVKRRSTPLCDPEWIALLGGRNVELRVCNDVELPATLGVLHPVILLPADCHHWSPSIRLHVLMHELAHIARNDYVAQFAAQIAVALFWFNPLAHLALRRMRTEAENASDDYVLRAGVRPSAYAGTLVALNETPRHTPLPRLGAVGMAGAGPLQKRVRAIVSPSRNWSRSHVRLVAVAIAAFAAVVPLTAIERAAPERPYEIDCRPLYVKNAPFRETSGRLTLDDGTSSFYFFHWPDPDRCVEASFSLDARFTGDDRDVAVTPLLHALVREKHGDVDRVAWVTESGGALKRSLRVNGIEQPWDTSADDWYHSLMPEVVRLSSAGIAPRAKRILDRDGLPGLVAELPLLGHDGIREEYLAALLSLRSPDQLPRRELIAVAKPALAGFEPAFARLLSEIVMREGTDRLTREEVLSATAQLTDGADRNTVLEAMSHHPDADVRGAALDAIALLPDDVWHRIFLDRASDVYLHGDAATIDAYFRAVEGIRGSYDRNLLLDALLERDPSAAVRRRIALAR